MLAFVVLASLAVAAFAGSCDNEAPKFYQCLKDSEPTPPPKVIGGPGGTQEGAKAAWEAKEKKRNECFTTNGCPLPLRAEGKGEKGKGEGKGEEKGVGSGVNKERNTERETLGKCMNISFANLENCVGKDHFPTPPKPEHGGLGGPKCEQRPGGPPCPQECEQRPGGPPCPQPHPECEQRPGGPPCPQPECEQRPGGPPCPQPECEQRPGGPPCPQPQPHCEQRPGGPPCPVPIGAARADKGVCPKFEDVNKCLDNLNKEEHQPMPGGDQGLDPQVLCKKRQDEQRAAEKACINKMSPTCKTSYTASKAKACTCAKTEKPIFEKCAGSSAHPGMSDMFIKMVCDEDRCTQQPLKG